MKTPGLAQAVKDRYHAAHDRGLLGNRVWLDMAVENEFGSEQAEWDIARRFAVAERMDAIYHA